jgi:hypothetical protein
VDFAAGEAAQRRRGRDLSKPLDGVDHGPHVGAQQLHHEGIPAHLRNCILDEKPDVRS